MQPLRSIVVLMLAIALAGCSSWDFKTDYAPSAHFDAYRTFAWHPKGVNMPDNPRFNSRMIEDRIRIAVGKTLADKGLTLVASAEDADLLITFHAAVDREMSLSTINSWYGYGYYRGYPYYGGWGSGASTTYVNQWDQGTLIVDLIQNEIGGDDDFLVWRGAASGAVGETRRSPAESQAFIDGILANMFANYPPKQ